eukprot:2584787-Heterocapsa_arctica.AAC.1
MLLARRESSRFVPVVSPPPGVGELCLDPAGARVPVATFALVAFFPSLTSALAFLPWSALIVLLITLPP